MSRSFPNYSAHKKAVPIIVAVLFTASVSGFFMGLRQTDRHADAQINKRQDRAVAHNDHATNGIPTVVEYARLSQVDYKANASWSNHLDQLLETANEIPPATGVTGQQREEALLFRQQRRAYDGAPPVVPHPIDQISPASCLACHGEGKQIKDRIAPKMSHGFMHNCTQCHVPSGGTEIKLAGEASAPLSSNEFNGVPSPGKGQRAYAGAPPTIPHSTLMRGNCASCHGTKGAFGLRTPHPWQQSCTQCHAPSAELDQRLFKAEAFPANERERK